MVHEVKVKTNLEGPLPFATIICGFVHSTLSALTSSLTILLAVLRATVTPSFLHIKALCYSLS